VVKQELLTVPTAQRRELVEITDTVRDLVKQSGLRRGLCHVFVAGATAAVAIHEGDDPALKEDLLELLDRTIPDGRWRHDRIDDNGAAHLRSAWIGPSETMPIRDGGLALGAWQSLFLCEFDGPRPARQVWITLFGE
jgi:secondary thiamine-phosphate synthase enzyme